MIRCFDSPRQERIKAEADKKLAMLAERRKRDPKIDGPARPVKPPYNEESSRMIDAIRSGQLKERYFYDDGLRGLLIIQNQLEAARRDRRARQPLGEDSGSDAAGGRGVAMPAVKKAPPTLKAVRKKKG